MALKSTIFRAEVQIADMDRGYYQTHSITLARHPSETDERMMMRLLAFILHASDALTFGEALSSNDEPDLWERDLTGAITSWIMVGLPDEKQIKKALSRSLRVVVYSYGSAVEPWWSSLARVYESGKLLVVHIAPNISQALKTLVERSMKLHCTIQDGIIWLSDAKNTIEINPVVLKKPNS